MASKPAADSSTAAASGSAGPSRSPASSSAVQQVGSPRREGVRAATQLIDATEQRVEQLERRL